MFDTEQFIIEIQQNDCIWNKRKYFIELFILPTL